MSQDSDDATRATQPDIDDGFEQKSFLSFLPVRNLIAALMLVGVLVVIVTLRNKSGSLLNMFSWFMVPGAATKTLDPKVDIKP
jgi:hypothetical protein